VATEPVAGYLLEQAGIEDLTPAGFVEQSESDAGPSVLVRQQTVDLITTGRVGLLVRGAQTEDPVTQELVSAADVAHLPTVAIDETLPEGVTTYVAFAQMAIRALEKAAGTT
jgi:zinc/manganese transport system substrate-binding protein